jgi:glycerol-1-phosphate dehydrogenase [NAD(P)+]
MMILTPEDFTFECTCGKKHASSIRKIVIGEHCLADLSDHLASLGLHGRTLAVYDTNTAEAKGLVKPAADYEVILDAHNLHADENAVAVLLEKLPDDARILIAVGSGTIHDIVRYVAAETGRTFESAPTAASVDGFASGVAAMTWHGFKRTFPAVAPVLVLADLSVIGQAPFYLSRSGVGDILGKYTALADWKIASVLTGEYYCEGIAAMMDDAVSQIRGCIGGLLAGEPSAYEKLIYGLLLSGVAMELSGNSRPASGAEHHISHFLEIGAVKNNGSLHGEKVGVGTLITLKKYKESVKNAPIRFVEPPLVNDAYLRPVYGSLTESVLLENKSDVMSGITPDLLAAKWSLISEVVQRIPPYEEILELMERIGAKTTLTDLGVDDDQLDTIVMYSPYVRARLTFMRLIRMLAH